MQEIKLIILLKSLNKEEFRRLGKFLNSPFYNHSIPPILLYEGMKRFYPNFDSPKLTKESIWKNVHPKSPIDANKFWQLTSKLTRLVEQFLLTIELEKHPREKQKLLIKALAPRNKKLLVKAIEEVDNELEEKKKTHAVYKEDFLHQLSLSNFHGIFNTTEAIQYEERFLDRLELFYLSQKIKTAINLKSVEKHRNLSYFFYLIPEIIQLVESDSFNQNLQLSSFVKLFQLVDNGSLNLYIEVKELYIQLADIFNREDKRFIFHHLMNYVTLEVNRGNGEFIKENLELYKTGLQQSILIENGKISYRTFTNIIAHGAGLKEFEWTERFMEDYEKFLSDSSRKDAILMGQGILFFFKKDFSATIDILIHHQFRQSFEMILAKGILVRSYFELFLIHPSYYDLFIYFSKSFEKYLYRDDFEAVGKVKLFKNFLKTLIQLVELLNENKFHDKKVTFLEKVKKQKMVLKPWLLEKINSIKKERF